MKIYLKKFQDLDITKRKIEETVSLDGPIKADDAHIFITNNKDYKSPGSEIKKLS